MKMGGVTNEQENASKVCLVKGIDRENREEYQAAHDEYTDAMIFDPASQDAEDAHNRTRLASSNFERQGVGK